MRKNFYKLFICSLLFLLVSACGGGGGKSSQDDNNNVPSDDGHEVDLINGGTIQLDEGVVLRVQEGSGQKDISVAVESSGESGATVGASRVVSKEYTIESSQLTRGDLTSAMLVSIPVSSAEVGENADPFSFDVQVFNEETLEWDWVDGWSFYDADDADVSFWTGHFSRYRVLHSEPSDQDNYERYRVNSRNFALHYYEAAEGVFGSTNHYAPPSDVSWQGRGLGTDTSDEIPNYIEDLDEALEDALEYYLSIKTSSGDALYSAQVDPYHAYVTYLPKKEASGDSKLGIMRISADLDDYADLSQTATHELAHVVNGEYYTVYGAAYNRWFYEASADLFTSRALNMNRADQITYFSRLNRNFLLIPLDASDEGSYYTAADFLYWLEAETGKPVTADVIAGDYTNDLTGLNAVLTDDHSNLSDYFTEYVLQTTVGDHDLSVNVIAGAQILKLDSAAISKDISLKHLSTEALVIKANIEADGLLVVSSDRSGYSGDLKTFSYQAEGLPVDDTSAYMEDEVAEDSYFVIPHFGKRGTSGVTASTFYQMVINPELTDSEEDERTYPFETYLIVPPRMQISEGRVDFTYDAIYPTDLDPIAGYKVYLNGVELTGTNLAPDASSFAHASIHAGSKVVVTAIDKKGNEWPEVEPGTAENWEMRIDISASFDDINRCSSVDTSITSVGGVWIPVNVDTQGNVAFNYDWEDAYRSGLNVHMEGSGTYLDETLKVSGEWTSEKNVPMVLGSVIGENLSNVGSFTVGGRFILGTFFETIAEQSATARAAYTEYGFDWDNGEWFPADPVYSECLDQSPIVSITDFRQR